MENKQDELSRKELLSAIESISREHLRAVISMDDVIIKKLQINRTDLRILDALIDGPSVSSELVNTAGVTPSTMTSALDRLESRGFIVRKRDLSDRRKVSIELAPRFVQILAQTYTPIASEEMKSLGSFNENDLTAIYHYLCMERDLYKKHRSILKKEHIKIN
jgi:DNA-binding MarR family transcriptional regulator